MATVLISDLLEWLFPDYSFPNCRYKLGKYEENIFSQSTSLWLFKTSEKEDYSSDLLFHLSIVWSVNIYIFPIRSWYD